MRVAAIYAVRRRKNNPRAPATVASIIIARFTAFPENGSVVAVAESTVKLNADPDVPAAFKTARM